MGRLIDERDGEGIGHLLRVRLPEAECRKAVLSLLSEVQVRITFEAHGLVWTTDVGDDIAAELFSVGSYEGEELDALIPWLNLKRPVTTYPTVLDVGANIGTTTLPIAQQGYQVVAIEPVPRTFNLLQENVQRNGFHRRVRCLQTAVSDSSDTVDMWLTVGSSLSEVVVEDAVPGFTAYSRHPTQRVQVPAARLSSIVHRCGIDRASVALVWSDAQGSETSVLETGLDLWGAGVPIYLEVWPHALAMRDGGVERFVALAETWFSQFLTRDRLLVSRQDAVPEDIQGFAGFVASIASTGPASYSDALLIPPTPTM